MTYLGSNILSDAIKKVTSGDALKKAVDSVKGKITGSGGSSLISQATDAATSEAAGVVANNRAYQINRERFAVATQTGYDWLDRYTAARPTLFIVGIIGVIASSYALYKRRKKAGEAVTLYSVTGIASGVLAFLTKPPMGADAEAPPAVASTSPGALKSAMLWADKKGADLTAKSPGWEKATLTRLWSDVGQGPMQPAVNVLLTKNSH